MERLTNFGRIAGDQIRFVRDERGEWVAVIQDRREHPRSGYAFFRTRVYQVMDEDDLIPVLDGLFDGGDEVFPTCVGSRDCNAAEHIEGCHSADPQHRRFREAFGLEVVGNG